MLIRPGAQPGPVWMRNISDSLSDPDRSSKFMMPFWAFFLIYMVVFIGLAHFVTAVALSKEHAYESSARFGGCLWCLIVRWPTGSSRSVLVLPVSSLWVALRLV